MNAFIDTVMVILFVLFMVFILNGYHRSKLDERESKNKKDEE